MKIHLGKVYTSRKLKTIAHAGAKQICIFISNEVYLLPPPPHVDEQPQLSADHPVNGFDFGLLFFLMPSVNIGVAARKKSL